jgi:mediator of RNA polymerase II transcription subunit 17
MADSLSLSLQAFPSVDKDKQSLQYLISRINDQKGSFRNVTEQSLEEEIQALGDDEASKRQEDVLESVENVEAAKTKTEEVASARDEILKYIA